jgi:hypothetical protein
MKEGKNKWTITPGINEILLGIIVIVGAILRFWNYSQLPFSYDEFSALFRTRFDNLSDLFEYGVKTTDTHPPGIQVFMFFWVKLFGESEMAVKLPFIHLGLLAIILAYKVGKQWFNPTVGLFAALFLSVLQYPITYSQFARPYISGLFFSLLLVWFWTNVVFYPEKKKTLNRIGFIVSGVLCVYDHHFCLLLAGLIGISGFFYIKRKYLKSYLLICGAIVVLYLPNLPIFFYQLNRGGVEGWLGKPKPGFIIAYFTYILHFSWLLYGLTFLIIILSFVFFARNLRETNKFRFLALAWFSITYLTGYFYSVYINAVLQYSVLIFVFPFMVFLILSFYRDVAYWIKISVIVTFMAAGIYTLIYERQHYRIMYQSAFKEILIETDSVRKANKDKTITTVLHMSEKVRDYYDDRFSFDTAGINNLDSIGDFIHFREFVNNQNSDLFILGWCYIPNIEYRPIVEERYPYLLEKNCWFTGEFFVYSKDKPDDPNYIFADTILFSSIDTFDTLSAGWEDVVLSYQLTPGVNYKEDKILRFNKEFAYSPKFSAKLKDITSNMSNEVFISVDTYVPIKMVNPVIICEFIKDGKVLDWRSANVSDFVDAPLKRLKAYLGLRLADLQIHDPDTEIWVYFWNKNLEEVYIDDFRIEVRSGNPVFYGLYRKL